MPIGNGGIIGPANVPTITTASGVWSLREQQQAQGRGAWPLAIDPDPYFEYTTLLLPGNGTDGKNNNAFLDSGTANSGSGFTITRNGNTTQGTFSPFSQTGWGNYFDGSGDYLSVANNAALNLGSSNYTIECWFYAPSAPTANDGIFTKGNTNSVGSEAWSLEFVNSSGNIGFGVGAFNSIASYMLSSSTAATLNAWNHIAVVRNGTAHTMYLNGVSVATATASYTVTSAGSLYLGTGWYTPSTRDFIGYISNARLVIGTAVYTGAFTPSTTPLTAITNTQLLTCQSNRFIDNSTNNFTITRNGDTRVVAFSPFNPSASWSAATYGGSGYFDGSGDYLSSTGGAATAMGTGDFTWELFVYITAQAQYQDFIDTRGNVSAGSSDGFAFTLNTGTLTPIVYTTTTLLTSSVNVSLNAWNHVALTRSGTTLTIWVNGASGGSVTNSTNLTNQSFSIGGANTTSVFTNGYISNVRIVKGTAVYTSAFTPPTAPLTAISGTSLLLNFTNAGIYDATSKNDLETLDNTVNGVRISTAQSQFGGSSIYFDGTGTDYLWIQADQPIQRFGTAPFTIELWIRLAATGSARGLVAKGTSTTGWLVSLNTSNQVVFTYGTSTITSTGTISSGVWTYIAVVREGTGSNQTKIYIGGVNDGTGTVSTDFTQTSSMYIGADRTGGSLFSGYMQDVRITNGYARTVTTIPTAPFSTL